MKSRITQGYRYPFALVGFGGTPRFWWMHFLKKGFYHCFVALGNGFEWILIDSLSHFTDAIVLKNVNIEAVLTQKGYRLIRTTPDIPPYSRAQLMPFTCVETVKRFLGIKNRYILTPYQLYNFLLLKKGK
ncbi:MAG: hypothetical protein IKY98_00230 [Alphaproteobacteria bacterium]|nr:hypothetical protein [Alphaproteobacteria bacterium]